MQPDHLLYVDMMKHIFRGFFSFLNVDVIFLPFVQMHWNFYARGKLWKYRPVLKNKIRIA